MSSSATSATTLVSRALEGTRPLPDAYELVLYSDAIWVFAADEHGVTAQRMCVVPM
jgi:hypothetical protein